MQFALFLLLFTFFIMLLIKYKDCSFDGSFECTHIFLHFFFHMYCTKYECICTPSTKLRVNVLVSSG